uniref:SSD domain-containing protein n=1 Tax=Syphacia muris TaxID=451379 RepID=A0A0N5AYX8_9BILA
MGLTYRRSSHNSNKRFLTVCDVTEEENQVYCKLGVKKPTLDKLLVGKASSNSEDYSAKWRHDFSKRPTWCDADMALQQINRGVATGNRIALYSRSLFQSILFHIGSFVQRWPYAVIAFIIGLYLCCTYGLQNVHIETDIVKLWVSQGGRLDDELNYLSRVQQEAHKLIVRSKRGEGGNLTQYLAKPMKPLSRGPELPKENGLGGAFQVVIQTPEVKGVNVLSKSDLLKHVEVMEQISRYSVEMYGENWTLSDICFKPPGPALPPGPLSGLVSTLLDRIIPCIWITPIDCFWEGAKPLGPSPPLNLGPEIQGFVTSLPKGNVTWKNLNPSAVISEVGTLFDLGTIGNFFERAGIGSAYLDRWCIDPLDPECPSSSPNAFDACSALKKFQTWNSAKPMDTQIHLEAEPLPKEDSLMDGSIFQKLIGGRRKRQVTENPLNENHTSADDYYAYGDDGDYDTQTNNSKTASKSKQEDKNCLQFRKSFLKWMDKNPNHWNEFLTEKERPVYPNYGEVMTGGCEGFAKKIMRWPEDLIIGGVKRKNHKLVGAEAFQSVFLVSSGHDVYLRYKEGKPDLKPNLDVKSWTPRKANDIVQAWQRNFTKNLYDHPWNHVKENVRQIHPLASTSIADMLEEFSQFKFFVIFIGYLLMFIYAGWSQFKWDGYWFAVDSCVFLGIIGVLLVTYSSIAGLGLSTWLGIEFNAATTQAIIVFMIVPFLTLGLGVDDMFLLLHNYNEIVHTVKRKEIGVLMRETGMSILITSSNNIIAFMSGVLLPIPALRSFCSQSAILLFFNLVAIMAVYPAFIALDLRRRKSGRRDMTCWCSGSASEKKKLTAEAMEISKAGKPMLNVLGCHGYPQPPPVMTPVITDSCDDTPTKDLKWYTLHGFLSGYYIPLLRSNISKVVILVFCSGLFLFGCVGLYQSTLGLELSDVLPEDTAPSAFLRAREEYFSFYPMFAVLKGKDVDFSTKQQLIDEYRQEIGKILYFSSKSDFVIKVNGHSSEEYWMSLMRTWLRSLQTHVDQAIEKGLIDPKNGSIITTNGLSDEAKIAHRLLCSYGNHYNCTGRVGHIRLVDDNGIINPDGFYNYITGWYNVDNMMYYVSQASFFPLPPYWSYTNEERVVPPAEPLAYSQIPFYLTNLIDTPIIVKMIKEIRSTCDKFSEKGLPNFPSGIAFTFWEQYLHLRWHLFLAICVIAISVFVVISAMVFNAWAAMMVMVIVVSMTVELAGFMGVAGVKLNPVSAVTLITAVGIGVEFTAHVVLAFLTSMGTKDERMAACMEHMFVPVIHGGISTLLGIVMLAFSEFEFVVKYFFVVMSALIIIGLINGLALLPVLLSLIGPPCEIRSIDCKNYLPAPPPLNSERKKLKKSVEDTVQRSDGGGVVEMQVYLWT